MAQITLLFFLSGCGEDIGSNNKLGRPLRDILGAEAGQGGAGIPSQIHRERGAPILTIPQEISKILSNDLPDNLYRTIPLIEKDDEGSDKTVTTRTILGRPTVACGVGATLAGIDSRITDCFQKNSDKSLWEGFRFGTSGEGTWKLVSLSNNQEVWLDNMTGLVWSDVIITTNWCQATGNDELPQGNTTVNCSDLMEQKRICQDLNLEGLAGRIIWRLPTRNDFLLADLNGARFVLKPETPSSGLWTATLKAASADRSEAWIYNSEDGTLSAGNLSTTHSVRCVGAASR